MFDKFRQSKLGDFPVTPDADWPGAGPDQAEDAPSPEIVTARQRRRKLADIRQQTHQQLLEILNLSALVQASEADIKAEIASVLKSVIPSQSVAVSRSIGVPSCVPDAR